MNGPMQHQHHQQQQQQPAGSKSGSIFAKIAPFVIALGAIFCGSSVACPVWDSFTDGHDIGLRQATVKSGSVSATYQYPEYCDKIDKDAVNVCKNLPIVFDLMIVLAALGIIAAGVGAAAAFATLADKTARLMSFGFIGLGGITVLVTIVMNYLLITSGRYVREGTDVHAGAGTVLAGFGSLGLYGGFMLCGVGMYYANRQKKMAAYNLAVGQNGYNQGQGYYQQQQQQQQQVPPMPYGKSDGQAYQGYQPQQQPQSYYPPQPQAPQQYYPQQQQLQLQPYSAAPQQQQNYYPQYQKQ